MKRKVIVNLINDFCTAIFSHGNSKTKLVHGLVFSIINFCNALHDGLQNIIFHGLEILINHPARIIVGFPKFSWERNIPVCIDLHVSLIRVRSKYKTYLLTHKAKKCRKPLVFESHQLQNWRSFHDIRKAVVHRVPGSGFTNRCLKYSAPCWHKILPNTICPLENLDISRKILRTYIFSETFVAETKTIRDCFAILMSWWHRSTTNILETSFHFL